MNTCTWNCEHTRPIEGKRSYEYCAKCKNWITSEPDTKFTNGILFAPEIRFRVVYAVVWREKKLQYLAHDWQAAPSHLILVPSLFEPKVKKKNSTDRSKRKIFKIYVRQMTDFECQNSRRNWIKLFNKIIKIKSKI